MSKKRTTTPAPAVGAQTETTPSPSGRGDGGEGQTANPDWRYIPDTAETCYLCGKRADYHNNGWLDPAKPGADFHLCKKHLTQHRDTLLGHTDAAQLKAALDTLKNPTPDPQPLAPADWPAPTAPVSIPILVDQVDPNPMQPREDFPEAELKELADNIQRRGLIQPIVVEPRGDRYMLHDGERRWRAHKLLGLAEIPAYIVPPGTDAKELLLRAIAANDQRADLSPIERAKSYQKLHDEYGLSDQAIADEVNKSRSVVANLRRLLQLPEDRQAQVADGTLNERQALALLPLYQLPETVRAKVTDTWEGKKLLEPKNLNSDQIRASLRGAIRQQGQTIQHIDPDFVFSADGIHHPTCTGCDLFVKVGDDMLCLDSDCLKAKQNQAFRAYLEEAKAATGLDYLEPSFEPKYDRVDSFSGPEALQSALESKCPNLRLDFRRRTWDSSPGPEGFSQCCYRCFHNGEGCACAGALEAEKKARDKERKQAVRDLQNRAVLHVAQLVKDNHPQILRAILYTLVHNGERALKILPEKVMVEIGRKLVEQNTHINKYRPMETNQQSLNDWLARMGLPPLPDPNAPDPAADLDRRLARIEGWITELPDPAINGNLTKEAIAGNLTNLAKMAEELSQINDPALTARFDAAKRTLLARREKAEAQAAYADEVDGIRASLSKFSVWLSKPENHTNQKLLNRSADIGDLAYLVNMLIHKHGEQPEFAALMTEIETVENLCMGLHRKLGESAAPVEAQPEEVAA